MNQAPQNEELIQKLTRIVLDNLDNEQFGVSELAEKAGMNRSHLYRKIILLTNKSLSQFIREIRLTEALKLLKEESLTVSEAAYRVGFNNPSYFNSCFHKYFGFPPGETRLQDTVKTLRNKKREEGPVKYRYSFAKKHAFITIFFFLLIGSVAALLILKKDKQSTEEKSIAVLPLKYLSEDPNKQYLADGVLDAITGHLSKIEGLRVMPRTSVEQYRESSKSAKEIGEELGVCYLVEGSFLMIGNQVRLTIQLVLAKEEDHLFFKEYDRKYEEIFVVQSEVAQTIAKEIEVSITPEEKQRIEKIPTNNQTAYDLYLRGEEELLKYSLDKKETLEEAAKLFHYALEFDSTFANVYAGLAMTHLYKFYNETYLATDLLDSAFSLANIALSYDDQLAEAYAVRGFYYLHHGQKEEALNELDIAIKFNPNYYDAYIFKGYLYGSGYDMVKSIENFHKAASLCRGPERIDILKDLCYEYRVAGFFEKSIYLAHQVLEAEGDSSNYYRILAEVEMIHENYGKAIIFSHKAYELDSLNLFHLGKLARLYLNNYQFEESLKYYEKYIKKTEEYGLDLASFQFGELLPIAYMYDQNGYEEKADYYFDMSIKFSEEVIKLNLNDKYYIAHYVLAAAYAFRGEKDKAFEYLRGFNQWQKMPSAVMYMRNDPWWDNIEDEPEFQQSVQEWVIKYEAEHERVRKWLEENDLL